MLFRSPSLLPSPPHVEPLLSLPSISILIVILCIFSFDLLDIHPSSMNHTILEIHPSSINHSILENHQSSINHTRNPSINPTILDIHPSSSNHTTPEIHPYSPPPPFSRIVTTNRVVDGGDITARWPTSLWTTAPDGTSSSAPACWGTWGGPGVSPPS